MFLTKLFHHNTESRDANCFQSQGLLRAMGEVVVQQEWNNYTHHRKMGSGGGPIPGSRWRRGGGFSEEVRLYLKLMTSRRRGTSMPDKGNSMSKALCISKDQERN